ncbi:Beta-lactamase enzyme family protein [Reichenbachiella agariperforans]|uniref:Beta-lactamase enzyme family protein n=1 Tax=Reichenbachiella agariperforans TaxID=156994 RepID=A0A1M6LLG7_REIAG|nr:serine hydrolase [Reichenbachiella agariperforans]SHJ72058.1 Beta-lactamase enzyme family protein [Reichenbachiella agariperforans]
MRKVSYVKCSLFIVLLVGGFACQVDQSENPLDEVLRSDNPKIKQVMDQVEDHDVQICFTRVLRKEDSIVLRDYAYHVETDKYFYPASTVKFPVALLALEELNHSEDYTMNTPFQVEGDSLVSTVADNLSWIFAVSDNQAYNRLFEFLGADTINNRLRRKGVEPIRISHRVSTPNSDALMTKRIMLHVDSIRIDTLESVASQPHEPLLKKSIKKGVGYNSGGELIKEPFGFEYKNYYPVVSQHAVMKRLVFPELFEPNQRFDITEQQRQYVLKAMSTLPKDAGYDSTEYYDSYVKFLFFGDSRAPIQGEMKIYNKIGQAYGTLTDCAYVYDSSTGVEFLVTVTMIVNQNGIFNDNQYEYDQIGMPFLATLGQALYDWELKH